MRYGRTLQHGFWILAILATLMANQAFGQADRDLAHQLTNPVADLTTLPFQFNYDTDIGPDDDGDQYVLNTSRSSRFRSVSTGTSSHIRSPH
jgi:hypothetical protein